MTGSYQKEGQLICPKCNSSNGLKAEYCWSCYFDFVPNSSPKPSLSANDSSKKMSPTATILTQMGFLLMMATFSFLIIYGSWLLYKAIVPRSAKLFVSGWVVLIWLTWLSERHLPEPESDINEYWSLNPFNYKDNYNWFILKWHIALFIPRIVWITIKLSYSHLAHFLKIKDANNLLK